MKRLLQLNCMDSGSTGGIMRGIAAQAEQEGYMCRMLCAPPKPGAHLKKESICVGNALECGLQRKLNKFTGQYGKGFPLATRQLIRELERFKPDVVQLHNLHHQFFDVSRLFAYLKEKQIPTVWTLHDCWAITGHCAHYMMSGCDRWRNGCGECPDLGHYPAIYRDTTAQLFAQKKKLYGKMENLFLVAPSDWTKRQIENSFLKNRPITVIKNGIDLQAFKPRSSNFREQYGLENAFVILGVSSYWTAEKGIDVFLRLAEKLPEPYRIVLVGGDPADSKTLPRSIVHIPRVENKQRLAEIYTAADVFFNPTQEEVMGLVNVEALACGTPVVTFPTGGSPECIDSRCGICLPVPTVDAAMQALAQLEKKTVQFSPEQCIRRSRHFDQKRCMESYLQVYTSILQG